MEPLEQAFRAASGRIIAALAARFRDLHIAEDAFSEACARAAVAWNTQVPERTDAWLYRAASRAALDIIRKREVRNRLAPEPPEEQSTSEELMLDQQNLIPDERLRLIFVCCHPAVAPQARAALTLRLVCGLTTVEIARAFLVSETTLAQRLVRAKRKIAEAGVPFEIPGPQLWSERMDAVLSTMEIAYSKAHEDAGGAGPHAGFAAEMLELTALLARLVPAEVDALALAATVRFAEARRSGRIDAAGCMIALAEQDPARWELQQIEEGHRYMIRAGALGKATPRLLQATIHSIWCRRRNLDESAPWPEVLRSYDALLALRDDPITRLNRAVALAEVEGVQAAIEEVQGLDVGSMNGFGPYHAVRADLLRRAGRFEEAREAYHAALALCSTSAERIWLERRRSTC